MQESKQWDTRLENIWIGEVSYKFGEAMQGEYVLNRTKRHKQNFDNELALQELSPLQAVGD